MILPKKIEFKNIKDLPVRITDWIGSIPSLILHTIFFAVMLALIWLGYGLDKILLILTTAVSLEAIYLSIFIQMTINHNTQSLQNVGEDLNEIQEDVEVMEKDIDEIQEDIKDDDSVDLQTQRALNTIESRLQSLLSEIEMLKNIRK